VEGLSFAAWDSSSWARKANAVKDFRTRKTAFLEMCGASLEFAPAGRWNVAMGEAQLAVRQAERNPWKTFID
jgi:hypothetical protein